MSTSYDAWLEAPYQRECEAADRYEAALEAEAAQVAAELAALTVEELLDNYPQFGAKLQDIFMATPTPPLTTYQTYYFSLEECFLALVAEEAERRLATAPADYDGPEPNDFDGPDRDRDCDYWNNIK